MKWQEIGVGEAQICELEHGFTLDPPVALTGDETLAIHYVCGTPTHYDVIIKWDESKILRSGVCRPS
jgi:hypothetical protein